MRKPLFALALAAALVSGCGTSAPPRTVLQPVAMPPAPVAVQAPAVPVSVELPALGVTDDLVSVALDPKQEMELPPVDQVGWYRLAPRPGEAGRAVLAGHVDYGGVAGAFKRLSELKAEDKVIVTDELGVRRTFVVYLVRKIPKAEYEARTVPLVFSPTRDTEVALVTCGGRLVGHEYDSNVVVIGKLA